MTTQMITLKLEKEFLKEIDKAVKQEHYQSRTELIREAVRDRLLLQPYTEDIEKIQRQIGPSQKKVSDEEYKQVRNMSLKELDKIDSKKIFRNIGGRDMGKKNKVLISRH